MTFFDPCRGPLCQRLRGLDRWAHDRWRLRVIRLRRTGFRPDPGPARAEACADHGEVERRPGVAQRTALRERLLRAEQTHGARLGLDISHFQLRGPAE